MFNASKRSGENPNVNTIMEIAYYLTVYTNITQKTIEILWDPKLTENLEIGNNPAIFPKIVGHQSALKQLGLSPDIWSVKNMFLVIFSPGVVAVTKNVDKQK